jgi:tetratricopeptide (TPR) repeat protein
MAEAESIVTRAGPLAKDAAIPVRARWISAYAETGALDQADALVRSSDFPPAQMTAALERIAILRQRAGIPPGASDDLEPTAHYRTFFALSRSLEHGKLDSAAAEIERARKRWKTPGFDALACELHARQGNAVLLRSACQRALKGWERTARAHYWLGYLAQETRLPEQAEKRYRRAIELDPESSAAWLGLAAMLRKQGRHAELPDLDMAYSLRFGRSMPLN